MRNYRNLLMMALVASTLITSSTFAATNTENKGFIRTAQTRSMNPDFTKAAESTVNAVVSIKSFVTPKVNQMQNFMDPFEFFFGPGFGNQQPRQKQPKTEQKPQQSGLGSGVIISQDGYIVTNNHVVDGAEKLEVTLNDNKTYNAKIIGTDPKTDLALLKIEAKNLTPIEFGNSDNLKVGEWVLAVGNPFGFTSTVTAGIVSAKSRSISSSTHTPSVGIESFIQTDAAVNPGNSGGALVNTDGQLVGINTAIYSSTGNYAGSSFAIPTSIVKKVITDIKQYGAVQRAMLGVSFSELTSDLAKEKGVKAVTEGIYVGGVEDRSAAKEAGIQVGDVITALNGQPVKNSGTMMEQMSKYRPGDMITVTYYRDNKKNSVTLKLKNSQGNTEITKQGDFLDLGCAFKELSAEKLKSLQISSGIEVVGIKDGKFKKAGIRNGFIILDINNSNVSTRDDVEKIYKAIMADTGSDKVMFITGMYPTGKKVYYAVDLAE